VRYFATLRAVLATIAASMMSVAAPGAMALGMPGAPMADPPPLLVAAASDVASAPPSAMPAAPKVQRLRIVGGLAGVNQYTRHEEPFWTRDLPRLSNGSATAEIVPFDRAGIRPQEMLRLVQIGAVPFGTAILSYSALDLPELFAPDLAGLNPDVETLRRSVNAFRPYLEKLLKTRYGIETLALYVYPAQVTFCSRPLAGLGGLAGRRVRVSSASQSDWVSALGGFAVQTSFGEIVANMRSGNIECAITGTMSGNTIGLHEVARYIHTMPVSWGVAAFVANGGAWAALPAELKAMLRRELPKLEQAIWTESARETGEGIACNSGAPACSSGRRGNMTVVDQSPADERERRRILQARVLPGWIQRCGPECAAVWRQTVGPALGIELR
jgi:TRAP-type C4-dicarboxylate transport system substrate-binding protein